MKIAFDITQMKVGCAIIQAMVGGQGTVSCLFDTESWFTAPTPDMAVYEVTPEQLEILIVKCRKAREVERKR